MYPSICMWWQLWQKYMDLFTFILLVQLAFPFLVFFISLLLSSLYSHFLQFIKLIDLTFSEIYFVHTKNSANRKIPIIHCYQILVPAVIPYSRKLKLLIDWCTPLLGSRAHLWVAVTIVLVTQSLIKCHHITEVGCDRWATCHWINCARNVSSSLF